MKTMIVEARFGRTSENMIRQWPEALLARGVDELALAQRQHLPADRFGDVRDVDDPDHDRGHQSRFVPLSGPIPPMASTVPSVTPSSTAGKAQMMSSPRLTKPSVMPRK